MSKYLSKKHEKLVPYTPGEQPKDMQYIKLNTNESPFPPSKKAIELAGAAAEKLMLYPDPECAALTEAIADRLSLKKDQVLVTNGSDEILNFAFMAYCDKQTPAIFPDITYGFYKVFADINGVPYIELPLDCEFNIDLDALCDIKGTVFLANPNAPTGKLLSLSEVERVVASDLDRIVVVDEAYIDFGGESATMHIDKYENLLVTQTFSKSRSMAGARLGFGAANASLIADLNAIKYSTNPYNINRMSEAAGLGVMADEAYTKENCQKIIENREYAAAELKKLGFEMTESKANFIFTRHPEISGMQVYTRLREKGILVRHFETDRLRDYNRITVGDKAQMQALIKAMEEIVNENK